jgi:uncharacterized protein
MELIWRSVNARSGCTQMMAAPPPALRRLEHSRGLISSPDEAAPDAAAVADVIAEAFDNLSNGPTWIVGENMRAAYQLLASVTRNQAVQLIAAATAAAMGSDQ